MVPEPVNADLHRELGKISATLEEILRRLDNHAANEKEFERKIERTEHLFNNRLLAVENKLNYGLGIVAAALFFFEVILKFVKVG